MASKKTMVVPRVGRLKIMVPDEVPSYGLSSKSVPKTLMLAKLYLTSVALQAEMGAGRTQGRDRACHTVKARKLEPLKIRAICRV